MGGVLDIIHPGDRKAEWCEGRQGKWKGGGNCWLLQGIRKLHPKGTPDISRAGSLAHRMSPKSVWAWNPVRGFGEMLMPHAYRLRVGRNSFLTLSCTILRGDTGGLVIRNDHKSRRWVWQPQPRGQAAVRGCREEGDGWTQTCCDHAEMPLQQEALFR